MPQTEEEHLENQNLDYEDQEKHPDAEVCHNFFFFFVYEHFSYYRIIQINWQKYQTKTKAKKKNEKRK